MKNTIKILGIIIFTLVIGFNTNSIISQFEDKNDTTLSSLIILNIANASSENSGEACTDVDKTYTSKHGFTSNQGDDCFDSQGKKCGSTYTCSEDTSLPELPKNQISVCNFLVCSNS